MPRHLWTILCTNSSIDQATNNISLFSVIEQVQISQAPTDQQIVLTTQFHLVMLWMRSNLDQPEMGTARFSLQFPTGEVLNGAEIQVELSTAIRSRTVITIAGLPLRGPGLYTFISEFRAVDATEFSRVHELPLQVVFN